MYFWFVAKLSLFLNTIAPMGVLRVMVGGRAVSMVNSDDPPPEEKPYVKNLEGKYTRNGWRRLNFTLETGGEDTNLHSK